LFGIQPLTCMPSFPSGTCQWLSCTKYGGQNGAAKKLCACGTAGVTCPRCLILGSGPSSQQYWLGRSFSGSSGFSTGAVNVSVVMVPALASGSATSSTTSQTTFLASIVPRSASSRRCSSAVWQWMKLWM